MFLDYKVINCTFFLFVWEGDKGLVKTLAVPKVRVLFLIDQHKCRFLIILNMYKFI